MSGNEAFPSALSGRIGFLLAEAHMAARRGADQALAKLGLTAQSFAALATIIGDGPMSQQRLSRRLRMDPATMVDVIDAAEAAGLLARTRNPLDRREYALRPTAKGRALYARADRAVAEAERESLRNLDGAQARTLGNLLRRMLAR